MMDTTEYECPNCGTRVQRQSEVCEHGCRHDFATMMTSSGACTDCSAIIAAVDQAVARNSRLVSVPVESGVYEKDDG